MARRKMKKTRLVTIIVSLSLISLVLTLTWRYDTLLDLQNSYQSTMSSSNFEYTASTDDYTLTYWYMEGNSKQSITYFKTLDEFSIYTDFNDETQYVFRNDSLYAEKTAIEFNYMPAVSKTIYTTGELLQLALIPTLNMTPITYEGKACIEIKSLKTRDIVEKSTGLVLYSKSKHNEEKFCSYNFNTVEYSDVFLSNSILTDAKK